MDAAQHKVIASQQPPNLQETIIAWQHFLKNSDWNELIKGATPKIIGCGTIYELPNFLNRPNESFAIVDMGMVKYAEPHYHPTGENEIYFVLRGSGLVVVAGKEIQAQSDDVIVIEPNKAHFTIPSKSFVIAAVNTPPFKPENYIKLTKTDHSVGFDWEQFKKYRDQGGETV